MICNIWKDNFLTEKCRLNVPVDHLNRNNWYYMLLCGGRNFCKDDTFNGWCELVNGILIIVSIFATCCCHGTDFQSFLSSLVAVVTIILDIVKLIYMGFNVNGSTDQYEVYIIILSLLILIVYCYNHSKIRGIIPVLLVTIITGILETYRDIQA